MNKWFSLFPQGERDSFAAQAPRGAGGAGTHFAAAVFPHGADAGLRFPLRLFRRGRGLMISCRKLSVRVHILRCRGCFIFLFFFYGILPHWRLRFLPVLTGRKRSRGRNSRPRFRPKISPRRLPPRNSLPAIAQTSAPASRRPVKILPCGPVGSGMGGELYQC